jgi:hypothetical protein
VNSVTTGLERRVCGCVSIAGGAAGLLTTVASFGKFKTALAFGVGLIFIGMYAFGIVVGIRLLENRTAAMRAFWWYMGIQVPIVQTYSFTYFFSAFMTFSCIYRDNSTVHFFLEPSGGWSLSLFADQPAVGVGLNAFPILVLMFVKILGGQTTD